jgi:hypothetical protein
MRRALLLSVPLACSVLQSAIVHAQVAPDSTCSYSRCGLRVEHGFLSTRLVRGASGESVARLGLFGSGVNVLLAASDSAAHHARQYRSRRTTGDALGFVGAALTLAAIWTTDDFVDSRPLLVGSATLGLISLPFLLGARRSLDRAVWWYNRDLPRP